MAVELTREQRAAAENRGGDLLVSAAADFMGLILRVIKNVFQQAMALKEENDYTI